MRKSLSVILVMSAVLFLAVGCRNKPPRIPMRPAGPSEVQYGDSATYRTVTTDPNRDQVQYIFDWADTRFDTTEFFASGDTVSRVHIWSDTGFFGIRVLAKDEKGNVSSSWSDTHLVHVTVSGNVRPDAPAVPTGPDSGWVGQWQVFSTSAFDINGDSVQIQFIWDEGQTSVWSHLVASGTTVTDSVRYLQRGTKRVRAVARDQAGLVSDTSDAKQFVSLQENTAPTAPVIFGPARGILNGPHYRFQAQSVDNEGDSVQYKFIWGDGTSSGWTALGPSGARGMDSLLPTSGTTWQIRAIARDQLGLVSDTSAPFVFEIADEGEIIWSFPGDEFISSPAFSVAAAAGEQRPAVVVGGVDGYLYAIDAYQGAQLFAVAALVPEPFGCSPAIGNGNAIYIGSDDGKVYSYAPNGGLNWSMPDTFSSDEMSATPAVDGNFVYVGGEDKWMRKLQDNGGSWTLVWNVQLADEILGSPAIAANGNIIVADDSGYVNALDPSDGHTLWRYQTNGGLVSSPALDADGNIYIGTDQGELICLHADGAFGWRDSISGQYNDITSSPVVGGDGSIYFGCDNGNVYKLGSDGTRLWTAPVCNSRVGSAPLLCADGVLYVAADNDSLYALDASDGSVKWGVHMFVALDRGPGRRPRQLALDVTPSPVVDKYGIIYCASSTGVFAIAGRPAGTLATAPWPMFHHDPKHTGKFGAR
ncbi:MAG: PQQ-binding-like beta-propeller repeat protein [candidate division WOR-3 bacterium]